jgi:hypothetical protein
MLLKLNPHFFLGNLSLVSFLPYGPKKWALYVTCSTSTKGFINIVLEDYFDVVVFSLTIMGD